MAERRARVLAVEPENIILELDSAPCEGCSIGCRGRCNLFSPDSRGRFLLPSAQCPAVLAGDDVLLALDEDQLRRAGYRGYGIALIGLVLGAAVGAGAAAMLAGSGLKVDPDLPTFLGMVGGVAIAVARSRQYDIQPTVRKVEGQTFP